MAARLLSQGVAGSPENPLVVWNRTGSKCTALQEKFPDKKVIIKTSAREVIETCGITYSMLSTPEASKIVFESSDGVLAGVGPGKSIVDCATLAETDMQRMDAAVEEKGGYVDSEALLHFMATFVIIAPHPFVLVVSWRHQFRDRRVQRLQGRLFSFALDQKICSMKSRTPVLRLWAKLVTSSRLKLDLGLVPS